MLHASGEVGARTLIWTKGMTSWARLEKLPELAVRLAMSRSSPRHQKTDTDEEEENTTPRSAADSEAVMSGRDDDVDSGFESRFATEPGVRWDRTPGSVRSDDGEHVQEEDEKEEEDDEEEKDDQQIHDDALSIEDEDVRTII